VFVDAEKGSDWNSGLSPDQPLKTIAEAMNKISEDRTGVIQVFPGKMFFLGEEKKEYPEWPPKADNLNEEWWK